MSEICYINPLCYPYMSYLICTIYRPEKKTAPKIVNDWHWPFCTYQYCTTSDIKTHHIFGHVRNKMYNLQTGRKKLKKKLNGGNWAFGKCQNLKT